MDQEKIGKFIKKCRINKKLTQSDLAEKLGVSDRTIGNWENGRNMPDLSLFKPICEELDISINEFLSGEKIKKENYQEKLEENIINTIDYSNNKIIKKNNNLGFILLIFGILLSISVFIIIPSESSWGSIYSVIGGIISLIGLIKLLNNYSTVKKVLLGSTYFIIYIFLLIILDYASVISLDQAPRFRSSTEYLGNLIVTKSLFCNYYNINHNTINEYHIIDRKKEYNEITVPYVPFNRTKSGYNNIIKYKNKYVGNNSNDGNLINNLPLSEYNYTFEIKDLGLIINYHMTSWYINDDLYLKKSLIYNSVVMFNLIDNLSYIDFNFSGNSFHVEKDKLKEVYPKYNLVFNSEDDFYNYLEVKINDNEFVSNIFKNIFDK